MTWRGSSVHTETSRIHNPDSDKHVTRSLTCYNLVTGLSAPCRLRIGIQSPCNSNVKLTWLTKVGITVNSKRGIVDFYNKLCNYIIVTSQWISSAACVLYIENRTVIFICCSVVKRFNCKWPCILCRPCVWELCQGRIQEGQTKQSVMAWRTPKLSGRR